MLIKLLSTLLPPILIIMMMVLPYTTLRTISGPHLLVFIVALTLLSITVSILSLHATNNKHHD